MPAQQQQEGPGERTPLLRRTSSHKSSSTSSVGDESPPPASQTVEFGKDDPEDPRQWDYWRKMLNVFIISLMAILSPLASSMFTPAISQIAESLHTTEDMVVGATTGYVVMLGVGPCVLAPLSETFGRRTLYLVSFSCFTLLQIPTALSPNIEALITCRVLSGFFGSVAIANGGGTISDMFVPSQRAGIFGWYLLGPLLGPTLGPLAGGLIGQYLDWRWIFWLLTIICSINTAAGIFFLRESYAPVILLNRCNRLQKEHGGTYTTSEQDSRPLTTKLKHAFKRPMKILFTQPIVFTMAMYQAVVFIVVYSLFTNMESMFSDDPYNFNNSQVGLLYIGPGSGFLIAVLFIIPRIDNVYNKLAEKNGNEGMPEYRLPLANVGAVFLPVSLLWFGWTVQRTHWIIPIIATVFFGIGQVSIFNCVQNYYIDAFERYAASAIAAGAIFRCLVGGIVPLFAPQMFRTLGYGWGWTVFASLTLMMAPSPLLFMKYGERVRTRFKVEL